MHHKRSSFLGSGVLYTTATFAPVAATLLITPVITRGLGAEGYGLVGVGIALYQFAAILFSFGLPAAITRSAIISDTGLQGASLLALIGTALSAASAGISLLLLPVWGNLLLGAEESREVLIWPILSALALSSIGLTQSVFRAMLKVRTFVLLSISAAFISPLIGVILINIVDNSAQFYLMGLAIGQWAVALIALVLLPSTSLTAMNRFELWKNFKLAIPTVPHSIAASFLIGAIVVIARSLNGIEAAGVAQISLFLGNAPFLILGALNNSWAPMIYKSAAEDRPSILAQSTRVVSVLVLVLLCGFTLLITPVASWVAGPDLFTPEMVKVSLLAASAAPFAALYLANIHLVFLAGNTIYLSVSTPLSLMLSLCAVSLLSHLNPGTLWPLAIGVPIFHFSQWLAAIRIRKSTGFDGPQIGLSYIILASSFVFVLVQAILLFSGPGLWFIFAMMIVVSILFSFRALRSML